jgi:fumarate reductase subunit D
MDEEKPKTTDSAQKDNPNQAKERDLTAALSYIGILFIIPLLVSKNNDFVKFHVKQGLVLFIAEMLTTAIAWIPILGWFVAFVAWIVWIILAITGIMNVLNLKQISLPLIGEFAKNFKF